MRVVVTGSEGFIGDAVARTLARTGHVVVPVDVGHEDPCDVTDLAALTRRCADADAVVHLAAVADFADCDANPLRAHHVNAGGTMTVLQAALAAGVRRVVYASTFWAYDGLAADRVDEATPLGPPRNVYTATKIAGEAYCHALAAELEVVVCRLGTAYGPGARPNLMTSRMLALALAGHPLTVHGDGQQARQLVYVEDLAAGLVSAVQRGRPGHTYNLVGDELVTVNQVVAAVEGLVGGVRVEHHPSRPSEVTMPRVSLAKAARELGWRPSTDLASGLAAQAEAQPGDEADDQPAATA